MPLSLVQKITHAIDMHMLFTISFRFLQNGSNLPIQPTSVHLFTKHETEIYIPSWQKE